MLTTIERVKRELAITELKDDADTLITELIESVSRMVEDYCNRIFVYGEYTEIFNGEGQNRIYLKGFPVYEIKSIKINGEEITDYEKNLQIGEIYYSKGFPFGYQNIEITYTTGYDIENPSYKTPPDLEQAIVEEVIARFENLTTQTRTGENLVDLRTQFLTGRARDYFSRQRNINV